MKLIKIINPLLLLCLSFNIYSFEFFHEDIDYWNETKKKENIPPPSSKPITKKNKDIQFDWTKFKDPKNKEFFKEGNHIPPEPFMELARNPTDQNIKNWFEIIEAKNKLMGRLQKRMQEYLTKNGSKAKTEDKNLAIKNLNKIERRANQIKSQVQNNKRFRFRLYFESTCPHCKKMITSLKEIQSLGYYVEIRQVDQNKPKMPIPFPIIPASEAELKEKKITSWPVLFVADTQKQAIYRINGYFPANQILETISNK